VARIRFAVVKGARFWLPAASAVVRHPSLWAVAVVQLVRMAPAGWWRRAPFLPRPDPAYVAFRLQTAYGDDRAPEPHDVVTYLRWCREYPRSR